MITRGIVLPAIVMAWSGLAVAEEGHGKPSLLSTVEEASPKFCPHRVPESVCTRCHPELVPKFKSAKDWCGEHGVPESQCYPCHPYLSFTPLPKLRKEADFQRLSKDGEDVGALETHRVPGKVTVFDFYADWCPPCRQIDRFLFAVLNKRDDLAVRKLNVKDWQAPIAKRHLAKVPRLPYLVVYGKDGKIARTITGFDLNALAEALGEGLVR